ncbi:hypothetical protein [Raoultella terrigena]|uniref:hypothetical protein n=1 Tax=Raoultella terrigena TaxID=577 RepID=UPI0011D21F8F|nr:hypothetical protein [Raoultella terrigena]
MKFTGLRSSALPDTSDSVKECVNLGQWMLFKSTLSSEVEICFFLKTGKEIFALNETGKILASTPMSENIEMIEVFYFCDLPKPNSLSNIAFSFGF